MDVALAESDEVTDQRAVGGLDELEDKAVGERLMPPLRRAAVELPAPRQIRATVSDRTLPAELAISGFDRPASAFRLRSGNRARLKALDLLDPLPTAELD